MSINWTVVGWLLFFLCGAQLLMGSMAAAAVTFTICLFCLAVGDIIKAIQAAKEGG